MEELTSSNHYQKIAIAIAYINERFREKPSLEAIARHVELSPSHFQRLFKAWAGLSPSQFVKVLSLEHAKSCLSESHNLLDASFESGLSDLGVCMTFFVSFEAVTPGEFKRLGEGLTIGYAFADGLW
ncbi:MAG: AraC family transcriptional regulator [Deinococcales bacterium]